MSKQIVFDSELMLYDAVATSGGTWDTGDSPIYSSTLDLHGADLNEDRPGEIRIQWDGIVGATATLQFHLCTKATSPPTTTELVYETIAYPVATIAADGDIRLPLPSKGMLQYLRIAVTVATANITAGTISAGLVY